MRLAFSFTLMLVTINKASHELPSGVSLLEAVSGSIGNCAHVALAVNQRVIPRSCWTTHQVMDGDAITIITAAMGG